VHGTEYKITCDVCLSVCFSVRVCAHAHLFWRPNISKTVEDRGSLPTGNHQEMAWRIDWSRDRRRHVTLKGQGRDPNMLVAHYLENGCRYRLGWKYLEEH